MVPEERMVNLVYQEELAKRDLTESQELLVVMAVMVKRERGENQA